MKVFFRVDASARMSTGHLMRCLTLAEALQERGAQTLFVCREHKGNLIATLQHKTIPVMVLPAPIAPVNAESEDYAAWLGVTQAEDAGQTIEALNGEKPDWLVVDHYGLDVEWEQRLRPHVSKLMVIDDLASRHHDCDVLLDQNYSPEGERRYTGLVPDACKVLLGSKYTLLRKEFRVIRERLKSRSGSLHKILVFFTAGDDQGETLKAMQGIERYGEAEQVDVVVGQSNPSNAEISKKCDSLRWGYHCQVDYMASLVAQADLVIGAGGSSSWERCALGAPTLVTILANNQALIARALDKVSAATCLGWCRETTPATYQLALMNLTKQKLNAMSENSLQLVDARGVSRVLRYLATEKALDGQQLLKNRGFL
jgi:UDP-2,4-diacetamido-2,4,6-trideoxy-beta-L-altropyranose hydrolase